MATPRTEQNGRIVKKDQAQEKKAPGSLLATLQDPKMQAEIARALPRHVTADRMVRIVMTALRTTRNLSVTTTESFLGCVLQAAQLGLEPNTPMGHCYLIPRRNGKLTKQAGHDVYECTLVTGYQGMIELSMRSGKVAGVNAQVVRQGDHFVYELGLHPKLEHRPSEDPERENKLITHAYAVARIKDADPVFEVLSSAQLHARAARSSSGEDGPWTTDPEAMCRKTAMRALWKWIPKSPEMAQVEHVEVSQELGRSPVAAFAPEVRGALAQHGLEPIDTPEDDPHNEETGELEAKVASKSEPPPAQHSLAGDGEPPPDVNLAGQGG